MLSQCYNISLSQHKAISISKVMITVVQPSIIAGELVYLTKVMYHEGYCCHLYKVEGGEAISKHGRSYFFSLQNHSGYNLLII